MRKINVAYATMSDYYYYICVSMISILQSATEDTFVEFAILVGEDFKKENQAEMLTLMEKYPRHNITFYNVGRFAWGESHLDFIKRATYYRLALPLLLQEERCLYLDGDTLVCEDLADLFDMDVQDNYVAGVRALAYYGQEWRHIGGLEGEVLPDRRSYINAGVMLMNLALMRADNLTERFFELMWQDLDSQDQDVINVACHGRIAILPFRYNVMTKYATSSLRRYYGHYSAEELIEAWLRPAIIHYADRNKPWNMPSTYFGDKWWRICSKEDQLYHYFRNTAQKFYFLQEGEIADVWPFFESHRCVYCYGAGDFGKRLAAFCESAGLSLAGFVVSDGQPLPANAELPAWHLSELRSEEGIGLVLAMREEKRQGILPDMERFGVGAVLGLSDDFYLELPSWTYTYNKLRNSEAWQADKRPLVCFFLGNDGKDESAKKLAEFLRSETQKIRFKALVITGDKGTANEIFSSQGIFSLAAPFSHVGGDLCDNAGVAKQLSEILRSWSPAVLCSCSDNLDIGQRVAELLAVRHVFVNPSNVKLLTATVFTALAYVHAANYRKALEELHIAVLAEAGYQRDYLIFGTGDVGGDCYRFLRSIGLGDCIKGFVDNDASKQGRKFFGLQIFSPDLDLLTAGRRVIITAKRYAGEISAQLLEMGLKGVEEFITFEDFKLEMARRCLPDCDEAVLLTEAEARVHYSRVGRAVDIQKRAQNARARVKPMPYVRSPYLVAAVLVKPGTVANSCSTVQSILLQTVRPEAVQVWLEEMCRSESDTGRMLEQLSEWGVSVHWGNEISLAEILQANREHCLALAESGMYYAEDWLAGLLAGYAEQPDSVSTCSGKVIYKNEEGGLCPYQIWPSAKGGESPRFGVMPQLAKGVLLPAGGHYEAEMPEKLVPNVASMMHDFILWRMLSKQGLKTYVLPDAPHVGRLTAENGEELYFPSLTEMRVMLKNSTHLV